MYIDLHKYDLIIINSSGGKDSLCSIFEVCRIARIQNYDTSRIHVSHQELGEAEWKGVKDLVIKQSDLFSLQTHFSRRRNKDGYEESLLEYVLRRGKWPSNKQRYCTSDFKRAAGSRVVTRLTKGLGNCNILHVFGFRKEESPSRKKKDVLSLNKRLTTRKRTVYDWLPIHDWTKSKVWGIIRSNNLPYHEAYDFGMPRLSCCFCIFSPFDALVIAGMKNPELLEKYVDVEEKINHSFKDGFRIKEVKEAIKKGYKPKSVEDWKM